MLIFIYTAKVNKKHFRKSFQTVPGLRNIGTVLEQNIFSICTTISHHLHIFFV